MHDLDTLNRLNEQACAKARESRQGNATHVVQCYDGLNHTEARYAASSDEAKAVKSNWEAGAPGRRAVIDLLAG